jgi:regulator of sirC expression with transglutaminase-like and TPR domain
MVELRAVLEAIGGLPDAEIDLADAALQLARIDAPDADWQAARAHLSEIARHAAEAAGWVPEGDLEARANALSFLLWESMGYCGDRDTYDDLANANLLRVIERRRGMPVSLGILWLHAAAAAGWPAHGIDLPGHVLVGLVNGDGAYLMLDVFNDGNPISESAVEQMLPRRRAGDVDPRLRPMSNRDMLLRLQANIRVRRAETGDLEGALRCAETTLWAAPDSTPLWSEAADLQASLGHVVAALVSYERCLALAPTGPRATQVRARMDELRARLN